MVRILLRTILLMLAIASAIYIADVLSTPGAGDETQGLVGIGILLIILALIGLGNWLAQKIRSALDKRSKN
ncbi:MAG: hypothetical protein ACOYZ8_09605 [Chloroflexota bacterium]